MHSTHHTKVIDDMEFQYQAKIKKILVNKMLELCDYMSFATKCVK
jgi:hypothetical protein